MRSFLIAFALLFCNVFLMAKDKVSITSEPSWLLQVKRDASKKPDLKNVSNGYYLELFDRQTNIINNTIFTHFIRHIANETGVQNASEISVSYAPSYQNVVFHKIQVIRNGMVINHLNMKEIAVVQEETDAQDFLYYGMKRAFVVLKDIRKNDKIEASYSVIGFNPIFNNKFSSEVYLYSFNPITEYFESIIAEPSRKLNFNYYLNAAPPKEEIIAGNKVYHWDNPELKIWDSKNNSPSWYNQYPYITISEFSSWQEVAGWAVTLYNHYEHQLPKGLLERINEWMSAAKTDKDEFARLALRFVQDEIRYLGFEVGINTHKPHEPQEVYNKGYGDCKDKALLLATILRHENITAYVALVNTEKKGEMYKSAPDPGEFNHVIVAIERENGLLYVDPTISMQKGELSDNYIPPYGYALVVRENESNLRSFEPGSIHSIYIKETLKVKYEDTCTLSVYSMYKGSKAEQTRSEFSDISMSDLEESYVKYYAAVYDNIKMKGNIDYTDDTIKNTVLVKEEYIIPGIWSSKDKKKLFDVYAKAVHQEIGINAPPGEDYPVEIKFPTAIQYTLNIEMPENWSFPTEKFQIKNDSYQFDFESTIDGKNITLKYYYKTFKDHIPAEELEQYRSDYKRMTDVIEYNLSYTDMEKVLGKNGSNVSWLAISITLAGFLLMGFLIAKVNRKTVDVEYDRDSGWQIGGWMVVLGITLCIALLVHFFSLFDGEYFKEATWLVLKESGQGLYAVGIMELVFDVIRLSACIAVVMWFFKRRDIFPKMFVCYVGIMVTTQIILWLYYSNINIPQSFGDIRNQSFRGVLQSFIYSAIWCTYVLKSYRTRATFLKSS